MANFMHFYRETACCCFFTNLTGDKALSAKSWLTQQVHWRWNDLWIH